MKTTEPTNKQWKDFCQRVIDTKGNPSTKDAEETGVSFTYWFEFVTRIKQMNREWKEPNLFLIN